MFELNIKASYLEEYYSCDMLTTEEWDAERNPNLIIGMTYIILASIFLIVYIPVIIILSRKEFLSKSSCYPLMLSLSFMDVFTLLINGITFGYLAIRGDVLCTSYFLIYMTGSVSHVGWYTCTNLCITLAFNRLLEATNQTLSKFLFEGRKIIIWMSGSLIYGLFIAFFTPPMLFTAKHQAMFFNPYIEIPKVQAHVLHFDHYDNFPHAFHNIAISIVLPLLYFTICTVFFYKYKSNTANIQMTRSQKSLLMQSFLLCVGTFLAGTSYIYFQYFPVTEAMIISGQLIWIMSHGIGSFVLGFFNPTIRNCIRKDFVEKILGACKISHKITMVLPSSGK